MTKISNCFRIAPVSLCTIEKKLSVIKSSRLFVSMRALRANRPCGSFKTRALSHSTSNRMGKLVKLVRIVWPKFVDGASHSEQSSMLTIARVSFVNGLPPLFALMQPLILCILQQRKLIGRKPTKKERP